MFMIPYVTDNGTSKTGTGYMQGPSSTRIYFYPGLPGTAWATGAGLRYVGCQFFYESNQ
jgi:hypothetical protein